MLANRLTIQPVKRPLAAAGFTIIEVLIVLAIAGIMLLLVFQAIPALERSSRNNQRRQDITIILQAVSHYELNNSGNFPPDCGTPFYRPPGSVAQCTKDTGTPNENFLKFDKDKLTFYTGQDQAGEDQVVLLNQNPKTGLVPDTPNINIETAYIINYEKCRADNSGYLTHAGAGYNDVVAIFAVETGSSGYSSQCQQL